MFCTKVETKQATCRHYRPRSWWKCEVYPFGCCMRMTLPLNDECGARDGKFSVHRRKLADSHGRSVAVSALLSITSVISHLIYLRFLSALPPPPRCESGQCGTSPSRRLPARNNSGGFEIDEWSFPLVEQHQLLRCLLFAACWKRGARGIVRVGLAALFARFLAASYGFLLIFLLSALSVTFFLVSLGIQALVAFQGPIFKSEIIFSF